MKNKNFDAEYNRITNCVYCKTKVKLNDEDLDSKTFFCPKCHRENVVWELRQDYTETLAPESKHGVLYFVGAISALILIFMLPRIFGIL